MINAVLESPIGPILLVGDGHRLAGLYTAEHVRRPIAIGTSRHDAFTDVRNQLAEYFKGDRRDFDVELDVTGTAFQRTVWDELRRIRFGQVASYGDIANRIGSPKAVRAVGLANGRNLISIIVPCHRVVGSTGKLTGYAGGLAAKLWLLNHEAQLANSPGITG